jgi:hypothetical protein
MAEGSIASCHVRPLLRSPRALSPDGRVVYADHPFFFHRDQRVSLVRGFAQFSVIADFGTYSSYTNVGTSRGAARR